MMSALKKKKKKICTDITAECPSRQDQMTCQQRSEKKPQEDHFQTGADFVHRKLPQILSSPFLPRFLSFPIAFSQQIKKGFHGCQEVLASCTRLWGYRGRPPHLLRSRFPLLPLHGSKSSVLAAKRRPPTSQSVKLHPCSFRQGLLRERTKGSYTSESC